MTKAKTPKPRPLTPKQEAFIEEYLIDLNATRAYMKIYRVKSEKVAGAAGARLLADVRIAQAVKAAVDDRSERTQVTQDYVLTNLTEVVERCMQRSPVMVREGKEMVQLKDDDDNHVWQFDSTGATKALTLLGRHLKMFTDKIEHSGSVSLEDILTASRQPTT